MTDEKIVQALEHWMRNAEEGYKSHLASGGKRNALQEDYIDTMVEALNLINRQKAEIKRLKNKCEDCAGCTEWKCDCSNIRTETIEEFWNNRPEQRNPEQQDKEEFNKGWNACLDSFFEVYEEMEKSNGSERSEAKSQQGSETC